MSDAISGIIALGVARQVAGTLADGTTTDNIPEGNNNLYFNAGRVRISLSGANGINYDNANGIISMQNASTSVNGAMLATDKVKLNGISAGAEVNQNALSNIVVGGVTVSAASKTETINLISGSGISLTGNNTSKSITIGLGSVPYSSITGLPSPTVTLSGGVTGSGSLSSLGNVTISTTVANNSHNHTMSNVTGLTSTMDNKSDVGHIHSLLDISEANSAFSGSIVVKAADGVTNKTIMVSNGLIMSVS